MNDADIIATRTFFLSQISASSPPTVFVVCQNGAPESPSQGAIISNMKVLTAGNRAIINEG